jgi:hypothetical protein
MVQASADDLLDDVGVGDRGEQHGPPVVSGARLSAAVKGRL